MPATDHSPGPPLPRQASALEQEPALDRLAAVVDRLSTAAAPGPGRLHDELRGRSIGHPLHSVLTDLPLGLWIGAVALDTTRPAGHERSARRLLGLGLLAGVPTALTGLTDFRALSAPGRRLAAVHATFNGTGTVLALSSWCARRAGHHGAGALLSAAALGAAGAGAFLGGHLAQAMREPRTVPAD